jgi:hypothetical protein
MGVNDLKRVIGRVAKSVSAERAGMRHLPPSLDAAFGVVHLRKGTNVFHSPSYFFDPAVHSGPPKIPFYGPTETTSPFFYTEDTLNSWMYQLEQDLVLLKLYKDVPPHELSKFHRMCLKEAAYAMIFDREPRIPLFQWKGDTSMERDSLVEAVFALGHDGFMSTADNSHDDRLEVCIHKTELLSHVPRSSDAEVTTMVALPMSEILRINPKKLEGIMIINQFMKMLPGWIFMAYKDELHSFEDGTWKLPDREMQEHFITLCLSETTLPPELLPMHEELSQACQVFFQELSMLDRTSQQKKIKEEILQPF